VKQNGFPVLVSLISGVSRNAASLSHVCTQRFSSAGTMASMVTRMKSLSCISVLDIFVYLLLKVSSPSPKVLLWV